MKNSRNCSMKLTNEAMKDLRDNVLTRINTEPKYKDLTVVYYDTIADIDEIIHIALDGVRAVRDKTGREMIDCACAFDIETTNITTPEYRWATMYHWQMLINNVIILGRTWDEWFSVIEALTTNYCIPLGKWCVIYIHNLSYEFQFIRKFFDWKQVFARSKRSPIYAQTTSNIEFRCSYMLGNTSLALLTKEYGFEIEKEKDYDYDKMRHCKTPLTEQEIRYCVNDVASLYYYINHERKRNGDITKIPLTQTGYVRRELVRRCYPADEWKRREYHAMISKLKLTPDEYFALKRAYCGGFTHASCLNVNTVHRDVVSYDEASAYPAAICSEKYPMSSSEFYETLTLDEYRDLIASEHNIVADFLFANIRAKEEANEHYLAIHKCRNKDGVRLRTRKGAKTDGIDALEDNSKLIEAPYIDITITEVDFELIELYYDYDDVIITEAYVYESGFLPKPIIELCIDLYTAKTTLKGVEGREDEYLRSKQMLNSIYGMMVTDIVQDDIIYTPEHFWNKNPVNIEAVIINYNKQRKRTLFYPWGVYVTAYARRNLLQSIWAMGYDYVYSDTDSVKLLNSKMHESYFRAYNDYVTRRIEHILTIYKIPIEGAAPVDPKGKRHPLGHFEVDEVCTRFKTLGAKRYFFESIDADGNRHYTMTVAGVNKIKGRDYLVSFEDPFNAFCYDTTFPASKSGKLVATYTDDAISGEINDGESIEAFEELSCTNLTAAEYHMDVADDYLSLQKFLLDNPPKKVIL